MIRATTVSQVYNVVKNNGHVPLARQPSEAQLRRYASLVIEKGARFELDGGWSGRTKWQMSQMISGLERMS